MTEDIPSRVFSKGSACPELEAGKIRLYSMRFCPYAQRARLVLAHKQIPHETVNINLKSKPSWFLEKNPLGLVPVLEHDGRIVYESVIVSDYLDGLYPEHKLNPDDPYMRARDRMLLEFCGKFTCTYYKSLQDSFQDKELLGQIKESIKPLETALAERKSPYFGGDKAGMLDMLFWPHMERIQPIEVITGSPIIERETLPNLTDWYARMLEEPAVKATKFSVEVHLQYLELRKKKDGSAYDLGL